MKGATWPNRRAATWHPHFGLLVLVSKMFMGVDRIRTGDLPSDRVLTQLARFWAESANFGALLFLAKLTPATPILVEFCWGKEEESVIGITLARETILHVFLVDFGSLRPSGAIGAGFRAIGGHLQVILLQGSFQGHQGHFSAGAVWRLCASIFGDSKA
jgi:hypothetical protein